MKRLLAFCLAGLALFVFWGEFVSAYVPEYEKDVWRDLKVTIKENGIFYKPPTSNWPQVLLLDKNGYVKKTAKGQNPVIFKKLDRNDQWYITVKVDGGYWFKTPGIHLEKIGQTTKYDINLKWKPARIIVKSETGKAKNIWVYRKVDGK